MAGTLAKGGVVAAGTVGGLAVGGAVATAIVVTDAAGGAPAAFATVVAAAGVETVTALPFLGLRFRGAGVFLGTITFGNVFFGADFLGTGLGVGAGAFFTTVTGSGEGIRSALDRAPVGSSCHSNAKTPRRRSARRGFMAANSASNRARLQQ